MNLDLSNWKEFCIGDLFDIHPTKTIDGVTSDDCVNGGRTPLVVNQSFNNGIAGNCNYEATENGGIITFSDTWEGETFFYQEKNFIGFAHVQGMYPKRKMSGHCLLFITMMLEYEARNRYSYGRKKRRDIISKSFIKLPVDADGNPDWQFMEEYIKSLHHKPLTTKNKPEQVSDLKVSEWKEFIYTDIFKLKGGFYNKKPEHSVDGIIPFLASTDSNNGVTEHYSLIDIKQWDKVGEEDNTLDKKLFRGNCITVTVNGSVCNAYYQNGAFTCSHDITALYLKKQELNPYIATFLCAVIMKEKYRWSYGRKPHDVKKFGRSIIKLPVDADGNPDWQFMEDYIKSLPYGDRLEG